MTKTLLPHHREELHNSGLTDETITAAGVWSGNGECKDLLGFLPEGCNTWNTAIVYPFYNAAGEQIDYVQVKPDWPRSRGDGDIVKYESPIGKATRAYFPPGFSDASKSCDTLIVTEGVKKCLAATQHGFPCIGLAGVWNWAQRRLTTSTGRKYGKQQLIPDLETVNWSRFHVAICFDSDASEKHAVRLAEARLAQALADLKHKPMSVKIVRLPKLAEEGKTGLDDFLLHHGERGAEELRLLIKDAESPQPAPEPNKLDIARIVVDCFYTRPEGRVLVWHRGEFAAYHERRYRVVPRDDFKLALIQHLDRLGFDPSPRKAAEIAECIGAEVRVPFDREPPIYIGKGGGVDCSMWVSMANGIIDLRHILEGKPVSVKAHTPGWFSYNLLPYKYDATATCPRFMEFISEVMEGDEERIELLRQWTGYNLLPDTSMQKFMLMEGEGANGKSVYLKILRALLGPENVSHVPLEAFGQRFQLWPTVGKLANIVSEVGELAKPDEATFKAFTGGEDPVQIDRKGLPILNVVPSARITIATNTRPRWVDRSDGIWRRMLLLPWRVQIAEERQDKGLASYIVEHELSGVFNWASQGLVSLRQQGRFTEASVCDDAKAEYRLEANPARTFLVEECTVEEPDRGIETMSGDLYAAYRRWCEANGFKALAVTHFGAEVRRVFPGVKRKQREEGRRPRYYDGLYCAAAHDPAGNR